MLKLWFNMDNAAFTDQGATECARILREAASRIEQDGIVDYLPLRDINGNRVGELQMSKGEIVI